MNSRICKFTLALLLAGMALPLAVNAQTQTTCILSATSDVYVEIHDYAEERKGETTLERQHFPRRQAIREGARR